MKGLIIVADDLGRSEVVNRAIFEAAEAGAITAASLLANGPTAEEAAEFARRFPNVGLGLHLNLTEGRPLSPPERVRSLLNGRGEFLKYRALLRRSLISPRGPAEAEMEFEAQVERFAEIVGRRPDHLDSHKHVHMLPAFLPAAISVAKRWGVRLVRGGRVLHFVLGPGRRARLRPLGGDPWWRLCSSLMRRRGLFVPDFFFKPEPLERDPPITDDLLWALRKALLSLPEGVGMMNVHPGTTDWRTRWVLSAMRGELPALGIKLLSPKEALEWAAGRKHPS